MIDTLKIESAMYNLQNAPLNSKDYKEAENLLEELLK